LPTSHPPAPEIHDHLFEHTASPRQYPQVITSLQAGSRATTCKIAMDH
jgi:hypothetical protein